MRTFQKMRVKNTKCFLQCSLLHVLRFNFFRKTVKSKQTASKSSGGKSPLKNLALKAAHWKKATVGQKEVRRNRHHPGTVAVYEIQKYQNSMKLLIRKTNFQRTVRKIAETCMRGLHFLATAKKALQHTTEDF